MKNKKEKEKKGHIKWTITITALSFLISVIFSLISELVIPNTFIAINIFLILIFIFLGILFDIIGLAVTTADEKVFNSMASQKIKSAKKALKLIKNKVKVSSLCNDVIGDICGIVSGGCGLSLAIKISEITNLNYLLLVVLISAVISALTIGGKAMGKIIALKNSNNIVKEISRILNIT